MEFGAKDGASATALLAGCAGDVWSFDIKETPRARALQAVAGDRWHYVIGDSRTADVPECDLLFIDSMHNYEHVKAELEAHAGKVRRYLVFHDWLTAGSVSLVGETGRQSWQYVRGKSVPRECMGIMPAILELMLWYPEWHVCEVIAESHGFLILERICTPTPTNL